MAKITVELDPKELLLELMRTCFYNGSQGFSYNFLQDTTIRDVNEPLEFKLRMFLLACQEEDQNAE